MENQEEKNYIITESVAQGILRYLISRPFAEVHQLIPAIQTLKPATLAEIVEAEEQPKVESELEVEPTRK